MQLNLLKIHVYIIFTVTVYNIKGLFTCNCHKQKPQNVCRDMKSRTLSGIQNNVFDDHQVQGLF